MHRGIFRPQNHLETRMDKQRSTWRDVRALTDAAMGVLPPLEDQPIHRRSVLNNTALQFARCNVSAHRL